MATLKQDEEDGRLDLVPMIDCIMLLLLFFILTTKFTSEEKALSALLPTDQGSAIGPPSARLPDDVHLVAIPQGLGQGRQPSEYARSWSGIEGAGIQPAVEIRFGRADALVLVPGALDGAGSDLAMQRLHAHIAAGLAARERDGGRKDQAQVTVHCFSGLPWKVALACYDGVIAYERGRCRSPAPHERGDLALGRSVAFAPPRDRNRPGDELFELAHLP